MEIINELFQSFGLTNGTNSTERLLFVNKKSIIEITEKEIVHSGEKLVLRVPTNGINAMLFLAYSLTPWEYRAKMKRMKSSTDLLEIAHKQKRNEAEAIYYDKLLEVFIKLQLINRIKRDLQTKSIPSGQSQTK